MSTAEQFSTEYDDDVDKGEQRRCAATVVTVVMGEVLDNKIDSLRFFLKHQQIIDITGI